MMTRKPSVTATLLRYLAAASKHRAMYPTDHPLVRRSMDDLVQVVDLLLRDREAVTFQIHEDTFFLDNVMLPEESLRNAGLLTACLEREIGLFQFRRGVPASELAGFVEVLTTSPQAVRAAGGPAALLQAKGATHLGIEPPRAARPHEAEIEVDPGNAYDAGHTVVQVLRAQAARRAPLDMNKARIFLSAAIEVVRDNRFTLLGLTANRDYDETSSYHAVNVSILSLLLGLQLGLQHEALMALGMSALLHDIGKVRVPQHLLSRAAPMTDEERAVLQRHPVHGASILRDMEGLGRLAAVVAFEHHAHYDLTGYPTLPGKAHPNIFTRLVAVADAYDTVTCARRCAGRPLRPELGMKWIAAGLGTIFDPVAGKVFLKMMGIYPVGSLVELNTGRLAVVMRPSEQFVDRPLVRLLRDGTLEEVVDLAADPSRWITAGVDPEDVGVDLAALHRQAAG
ncbi:MAG: HD domain-containing protein [Armatimonadota bacterium]|nr:HD domain-containing protein [Armatimonadota bacterium]MDR7452324.1 HD domain-containing protein [Armatimonadota bacterium]MDR7467785.1 HD domain-containing protein [Armatimonadota bacterium]MDR7494629.1 HD domain-containing protein [Armatimonadota bacterium]MDR7499689.1 HD domain-containing protein [Armatimonadota bacterium]